MHYLLHARNCYPLPSNAKAKRRTKPALATKKTRKGPASEHPLVHQLVPTVPETDLRQSDVYVRGMSLGRGLPVVGDMCMGSALHSDGSPYPGAAALDEKAIDRLTAQKLNKYPELVASDRVHFVVLACEEGGR